MNLPERGPGQLRIGVAIQVPEPFGTQLQQARASFGDPNADSIPPHVTLLGPTLIEESAWQDVHRHLERAAAQAGPFTLHLRGSASFRPVSAVVFVQVVEGIASCELLERAVRRGPLAASVRFAYHPHVTVAHDVPEEGLDRAFAEMAEYEARFEVTGLHLYEHGDDEVWRPRNFYELSGSAVEADSTRA